MDLRSLKKEAETVPDLLETLRKLQLSWIKPLRAQTSPIIQDLDAPTRKEIKVRLATVSSLLESLRSHQFINGKLQQYSSSLIELKLALLRQDPGKFEYYLNLFLYDEFSNLRTAITEIGEYGELLQQLQQEYQAINHWLEEQLSLEEGLLFADLPHKYAIQQLQAIAEKQKSLIKEIGSQFLILSKQKPLLPCPR